MTFGFWYGIGFARSPRFDPDATPPPADETAPTITSADPSGTYDEGDPVGGTLTADESVTWTVTGTDAAAVTLNASTGVWSLETTDYETQATYAFTFTATDAADNTATQAVTVAIAEVLEWLGLYTFDARGATFDLDTVTMDRN